MGCDHWGVREVEEGEKSDGYMVENWRVVRLWVVVLATWLFFQLEGEGTLILFCYLFSFIDRIYSFVYLFTSFIICI